MSLVFHPRRFGRVQLLAAVLLCGGIAAVCLPWLISAFGQFEQPLADVPSEVVPDRFEPTVPLPEENLQGKNALAFDLELLEEGLRLLEQTKDYTGTFRKRERVDGILGDFSVIQVKSRHEPFSLYLKWLEGDVGRELLFVENERDGEMLVRLGGLRGRLLPALKVDPDGNLARQKVRHHISNMSILNLTRRVVAHCRRDFDRSAGIQCELVARDEDGRIRVTFRYQSPEIGGEYRKAIHFIDRGTLLPVKILTYGWPDEGQEIAEDDLDRETLLEYYEYSDLKFDLPLGAGDFDEHNAAYAFHRRKS